MSPTPAPPMYPILFVAGAVIAVVCVLELTGGRYRRLAATRRGESFRDFEVHFRGAGVHADVLSAAHLFFQQWTSVRGLTARPDDDLRTLYGLDDADVQDAIAVVAASAHCLAPGVEVPSAVQGICTVNDLVLAVHRLHLQAHAGLAPTGHRAG